MGGIEKLLMLVWKGIKSFGLFWKEFLIGDAPEIAFGIVIILGLAILLSHFYLAAVELTIIILAILLLIASVWRRARG